VGTQGRSAREGWRVGQRSDVVRPANRCAARWSRGGRAGTVQGYVGWPALRDAAPDLGVEGRAGEIEEGGAATHQLPYTTIVCTSHHEVFLPSINFWVSLCNDL